MKALVLNNWGFMRFFRLFIGLVIIVQSVLTKDILFGIAGLFFTGMAVFNVACCGMNGCAVTSRKNFDNTGGVVQKEQEKSGD